MLNVFRLPKNQTLGSRTRSPLAVKYSCKQKTPDRLCSIPVSTQTWSVWNLAEGGCFRSSHLGVLKLMYRIIRLFRDWGEGWILVPTPTSTRVTMAHLPPLSFQINLYLKKGFLAQNKTYSLKNSQTVQSFHFTKEEKEGP